MLELERVGDQRPHRIRRHQDLFLSPGHVKRPVGHVGWGGKVVLDAIEQRLDALVLECASHEDGDERETDGGAPDRGPEHRGGHFLLAQEQLGDLVVHVRQPLDEDVSRLLALGQEIVGDRMGLDDLPRRTREEVRLHVDEVHDARERILGPDRLLHKRRI